MAADQTIHIAPIHDDTGISVPIVSEKEWNDAVKSANEYYQGREIQYLQEQDTGISVSIASEKEWKDAVESANEYYQGRQKHLKEQEQEQDIASEKEKAVLPEEDRSKISRRCRESIAQ
jgi:hypothetical protein